MCILSSKHEDGLAQSGKLLSTLNVCFKVKFIDVFIPRGAELDARDKYGLTPLMLAAVEKCEMTFNQILKYEDGERVLKNTLLFLARAPPISHHNSAHKLLHVS